MRACWRTPSTRPARQRCRKRRPIFRTGPRRSARTWRAVAEDDGSVTHYFAAEQGGYRGLALGGHAGRGVAGRPGHGERGRADPGPEALVAPVGCRGSSGSGPATSASATSCPRRRTTRRLVPGYVASDDPAVEDVAREIGLGRERVLSREGRERRRRAVAGRSARAGLRHGPLRARHVRHLRVLPAARGLAAGGVRGLRQRVRARRRRGRRGRRSAAGRTRTSASSGTSPVAVAELVYDDGVDLEPA